MYLLAVLNELGFQIIVRDEDTGRLFAYETKIEAMYAISELVFSAKNMTSADFLENYYLDIEVTYPRFVETLQFVSR